MSSLNSDLEPQEIELYSSFQELEVLESQADLYAIIVATEHLERAYVRGIDYQAYKTECLKLLSQFKLAERAALRAGNIKTTEYVNGRFLQPLLALNYCSTGIAVVLNRSCSACSNLSTLTKTIQRIYGIISVGLSPCHSSSSYDGRT